MKRRGFLQSLAVAGVAPLAGTSLFGCGDAPRAAGIAAPGVELGTDRLAFGLDSTTFFIDGTGGVVHAVGPNGADVMLPVMNEHAHPIAAAGCANGRTVVVDASTGRATFYDASGAVLAEIGRPVLLSPTDVAVSKDGAVYVTDSGSHEVVVFDTDGALVHRFGGLGAADGLLNGPSGVALGADGLVYVSERGNARVSVFTRDGFFFTRFGGYGKDDGRFLAPRATRIDGNGRVYVADALRGDVQVFTDGVASDRIVPTSGVPLALATRPDGGIYVALG